MMTNSIKVYARLKKEDVRKKIEKYEVVSQNDGGEELILRVTTTDKPQYHKYRFHKVFGQSSTQNNVFDIIAKPVVDSVIQGYNGTIFAYGQTGSGKTYAITGSPNEYNERGIIPRSIQEIFESVDKSSEKYRVYVSYLEIYNEIGYDLLSPKQRASSLEELPRVLLLEDARGEAHLRNLSVIPVSSEHEAMKLLFLGDTNRTIAETPLNEYSSRSHCIFTVYVSCKSDTSNKMRRSKLNLVDLAGSERIHKSNITGTTLNEAKYINLSLHYLEQVILARSQIKRSHIPYRNSMMTYLLRDSLAGNCLTVMLSTLALTKKNIEETISTCKFAQRVALISTEAVINEEIDLQQEINFLTAEVDELRRQLVLQRGINISEKLSDHQIEHSKVLIKKFLKDQSNGTIPIETDMRQIQLCFNLLRQAVNSEQNKLAKFKSNVNANNDLISKYKTIVKQKDEEISILTALLDQKSEIVDTIPTKLNCSSTNIDTISRNSSESARLIFHEQETSKMFTEDQVNKAEIDSYIKALERKCQTAKSVAVNIETCQKNIVTIKKMLAMKPPKEELRKLTEQLIREQDHYRTAITDLRNLKSETDYLQRGLEKAQIKLRQEQAKRNDENNFQHFYDSKINKRASCQEPKNFGQKIDLVKHENLIALKQQCRSSSSNNSRVSLCSEKNCDVFSDRKSARQGDCDCRIGNHENYYKQEIYLGNCRPSTNLQNENGFFSGLSPFGCNCYNGRSVSSPCSLKCNGSNLERCSDKLYTERICSGSCSQFPRTTSTPRPDKLIGQIKSPCQKISFQDQRNNSTVQMESARNAQEADAAEVKIFQSFQEFIKTVALTGDPEVDDEIINFYKSKFKTNC